MFRTGEDSDQGDRPNSSQPPSRRHAAATTTRQQMPTSSQPLLNETTRLHRSHVQEDHNYGEPGPSSQRLSRRNHVTLSRHQRNADELDMSTTSLESDPLGNPSILLRLRQRTAPATTSQLASSTSQTDRNLRIRSNGDIDYVDNIDINVDDDDDDDDLSDPEDDKPLRYVANRSSGDGLTEPMRNRSGAGSNRDRIYFEDEYAVAGPSTSRTTRTQKRPHYNEESDDDGTTTVVADTSKKRLLSGGGGGNSAADVGSSLRSSHVIASHLRNHSTQPQNPLQLDDEVDSDGDQPPSVSSRGRVRKITAKARGLFRE